MYKHSNIYTTWYSMMRRCYNKKDPAYKNYGYRGITVCESWHDYKNFKKDMGGRRCKGMTIERIDNNGNYCPENCKWATQQEQANNKRNNRHFDYAGEKYTIAQLARKFNVSYETLRFYLVVKKKPFTITGAVRRIKSNASKKCH